MGLGSVWQVQGKADDAIAEYREAIRLNPKASNGQTDLAEMARLKAKYEELDQRRPNLRRMAKET